MFRLATSYDLDSLLEFFKQDPEINLFMIADLEFYGLNNDFIKVWIDDLRVIKTVVLTYHKNMLLYSISNDYDKNELKSLIHHAKPDFFSCSSHCFSYIESFILNDFTLRKHTLAKLTNLVKPDYHLIPARLASSKDAKGISESIFLVDEFRDYITATLEERIKINERKIEEGFSVHFVIEENGIIVANANTSAICSVAAMIGGVFTLSQIRNKGYATSVVYHLCDYLLKKRITPLLFFENPKAASIYHKLGFNDIDEWYVLKKK